MDLILTATSHDLSISEIELARRYAEASQAANTIRAYRSDLNKFRAWCAERRFSSLPAADGAVALFLSSRAGISSVATLGRCLAAIRSAHRNAGLARPDGPAVAAVWAGIKRTHGRPPRGKAALTTAELVRILPPAESPTFIRDRALLLLGFGAALRRSELAALGAGRNWPSHIRFVEGGIEVHLARSKTDQNGTGAMVAVPRVPQSNHCPVEATRAWVETANIQAGHLFRRVSRNGLVSSEGLGPQSIARVVKRHAARVGLEVCDVSAHSLRAGFATSAARNGAPAELLMTHMRHASFDTTKRYIRAGDPFSTSAGRFCGL